MCKPLINSIDPQTHNKQNNEPSTYIFQEQLNKFLFFLSTRNKQKPALNPIPTVYHVTRPSWNRVKSKHVKLHAKQSDAQKKSLSSRICFVNKMKRTGQQKLRLNHRVNKNLCSKSTLLFWFTLYNCIDFDYYHISSYSFRP